MKKMMKKKKQVTENVEQQQQQQQKEKKEKMEKNSYLPSSFFPISFEFPLFSLTSRPPSSTKLKVPRKFRKNVT